MWKRHLLKIANISIAPFSLHVIHPLLLKRNIIYNWRFWSSQVKYLNRFNMYKYTSLLTGGSSTHKTSAGARRGIGWFVKRFSKVPCSFHTSYDARPPLKSNDLNFQKSSGARPMCANGARPISLYLNDSTKRRTGAVEFYIVTKLHRAPYDV